MGLTSSLFSGVSGLRNHQKMMDVIGNNISNVNTVGFKSSRILFSETLNQAVRFGSDPEGDRGGMNSYQIGLGSQISSIDRVWAQGSFERTGIVTDLALEGEGMFILKRDDKILYTRAGALTFDANGNLVSPMNGLILQGKSAIDANGEIGEIQSGNQLTNINISPSLKIPAIATTSTSWGGNLKSDSTLTRSELFVQNGNFNTGDIVGTAYTDTNTIYDEDGTAYTFEATYTKTAADTFDFTYDIRDANGTSIYAAPPAAIEAVFDPVTGAMTTFNGVPAANFAFNVAAGTIPAGSTL
jgi:flagellar hook protein FlgE